MGSDLAVVDLSVSFNCHESFIPSSAQFQHPLMYIYDFTQKSPKRLLKTALDPPIGGKVH